MRWLLVPLMLFALLAPREECPIRPMVSAHPSATQDAGDVSGDDLFMPPLRAGTPAAMLGTDRAGRDSVCLNQRGLRRSMWLSCMVLLLSLLPGVALGLWLAWNNYRLPLISEVIWLLALVLILGKSSFRLVLGAVLLTARLVAVRSNGILREPFVEGAIALGGSTRHILWRHLWPNLRPGFPAVLATVLSSLFVWLMALGALGFYDQGSVTIAFTDGLDLVQDLQTLPLNADLGQLVSFFRWTWLDTPEQLVWPALLLTLLTLALKDLARWVWQRDQLSGQSSAQ